MSHAAHPRRSRQILFTGITFLLTTAIVLGILLIGMTRLRQAAMPWLAQILAARLTPEERLELYREMGADIGFFWEAVPEPRVARTGKRNFDVEHQKAQIHLNNAGLRSSRNFTPKDPGVFRIVCLGDSFVFGEAGNEEDRFCDRLEEFYATEEVTVDGRTIETYAVGLGSWTMIQEATYLSSRLSEYGADVILVLTVGNDFGDAYGVTGKGTITTGFTPEYRHLGSSVMHNRAGRPFGYVGYSAINWGIGPTAAQRWRDAFESLEHLADLQRRAGGRLLATLLTDNRAFRERYKSFFEEVGLDVPLLLTSYFRDEAENRLPHDAHPSRKGHWFLASHYIHALHDLGWVPVPEAQLPELDPRLDKSLHHEIDTQILERHTSSIVRRHLKSELRFDRLDDKEAIAILGGLLPPAQDEGDHPWATLRTAWLMKQESGCDTLELTVSIPARTELYPLELRLLTNGTPTASLRLSGPDEAGRHVLRGPIHADPAVPNLVEVTVESDRYFAGIADVRMKSVQLVSAQCTKGETS